MVSIAQWMVVKSLGSVAVAILMAICAAAAPANAAMNQTVQVQGGLVSGAPGLDPAITIYKGIPYAAPPVEDRRWREPQPPEPWDGVREAVQFSSPCLGFKQRTTVVGVEDCLYLNVWTGAASTDERRPVVFWTYEDGFYGNDSANPLWEGEGLARKGVIVVTFNYRAGVMGWLATSELSHESGRNVSGNYGLLDQIAALKWVHDNIAAFGGDPDRVTVAGQSAGGLSALLLISSPLTEGLYHRAILQSRARGLTPSMADAEARGMEYLQGHGSPTLQQLRAMPAEELKRGDTFGMPVVDGWVVPSDFYQLFDKGLQHDVPVLIGQNEDESGARPNLTMTLAAYRNMAQRRFGAASQEFLALYPATSDDEAGAMMNEVIRQDNRITNFLLATQGEHAAANKSYLYFWNHAPPGPNSQRLGAFHGSELNYVFNNFYASDRPWTDEDRRIADIMSSYWANFAANGDPNGDGLPAWDPVDPASPVTMELGDRFGPIPVADGAEIDFVRRYYLANDASGGYRP